LEYNNKPRNIGKQMRRYITVVNSKQRVSSNHENVHVDISEDNKNKNISQIT
jgi:hypothetical protein